VGLRCLVGPSLPVPISLFPSTGVQAGLLGRRGYAEKAVAGADLDWEALSSMVHSDEGKRELASLRTTFLDIKQRISTMSQVRSREEEMQAWATPEKLS
jgi:hypothetical protein